MYIYIYIYIYSNSYATCLLWLLHFLHRCSKKRPSEKLYNLQYNHNLHDNYNLENEDYARNVYHLKTCYQLKRKINIIPAQKKKLELIFEDLSQEWPLLCSPDQEIVYM